MIKDGLVFRADDLLDSLIESRKDTFSRGEMTGFHTLDNVASFKPHHTTVLYAPPHTGKSVITFDILMSLAERGKTVFIYSPEFRKPGELIQALIQTRLKKSFFGKYADIITDQEYMEALAFVSQYFIIVRKPVRTKDDVSPRMTIVDIFAQARAAEEKYGVKIDYIFADPFNYIDRTQQQRLMTDQDYVLDANDMLAEFSELLNVHTIISAHTRDMEMTVDKDTGMRYYPIGHPSQIMGGQSWFRASYQILHLWRAPEGVLDRNGVPYPANYTKVINQKAKPWGSGRLGDTSDTTGMDGLFFDHDTYTMYEVINGERYYRNQYYNKEKEAGYQSPALKGLTRSWEEDDDVIF